MLTTPATLFTLLVLAAALSGDSQPALWWQAEWTQRRIVEATGEWVRLPYEPIVAAGRFVAQPQLRRLPHWTQTVEMTAPRAVAADPEIHFGFPRLVRTADKRLLLFYRVGLSHASDPAAIAMRTSFNNGQDWSDERIIHRDPDGYCTHNPVALVAADGRVILFVSSYNWRGRAKLPMYWSHSDDQGQTWALFTKFDSDPSRSTYYMTDAIRTERGLYGMSTGFAPDARTEAHNLFWYSSDGRTWSVRSVMTPPAENLGDEVSILPIGPESFMVLLRDRRGQTTWRTWTRDGGRTWDALEDLGGQVEILQRPFLTRLTPDVLLLTGRDRKRALIVVYVSRDGGKSFAERHVIDRFDGDGGYTAAVPLSASKALLVYYADGPEYRGKPDIRQVTLSVLDRPRYVCLQVATKGTTWLYTRPDGNAGTQDRTHAWLLPPGGWQQASLGSQIEPRRGQPLAPPQVWQGGFTDGAIPEQADSPWKIVKQGRAQAAVDKSGALRIVDDGTQAGEMIHFSRTWELTPDRIAEIDLRLRVISCTGPGGCMLRVADGSHEEVFTFFPDKVFANRSRRNAAIDLASDYVTLQITVGGGDFAVMLKDRVLIDGQGLFTAPAYRGRQVIEFGSGSSAAKGAGLWKSLNYRITEHRQ